MDKENKNPDDLPGKPEDKKDGAPKKGDGSKGGSGKEGGSSKEGAGSDKGGGSGKGGGSDKEGGSRLFSPSENVVNLELGEKRMMTALSNFHEEGIQHGSMGLSLGGEVVEGAAYATAHQLRSISLMEVGKKISELEKLSEVQAGEYDRAAAKTAMAGEEEDWLRHGRLHSRHEYSLASIVLYSVFGIFLLLADIPLAVQLVQKGLAFPEPSEDKEKIHGLLTNFYGVIIANWEVFLTATGIAFCTAFIKLAYDEYISPTYGASTLRRRSFFRLLNNGAGQPGGVTGGERYKGTGQRGDGMGEEGYKGTEQSGELTGEERKIFIREDRIKHITRVGLLCLTLVMIVVLGKFRTVSFAQVESERRYQDERDKLGATAAADFEKYNLSLKALDAKRNAELEAEKSGANSINWLTFTFITFMFPVISGACFSMAISAMQNKVSKWRSGRMSRKYQKLLEGVAEKVGRSKGEMTGWQVAYRQLAAEEWMLRAVRDLVSSYNYGHSVGLMRPAKTEKPADLLGIVEGWRNKQINYRANQRLSIISKSNQTTNGKDHSSANGAISG